MTQEDKNLLLKDLCARLPYGVKIEYLYWNEDKGCEYPVPMILDDINSDGYIRFHGDIEEEEGSGYILTYLPYLRPLSSMTEEEEILFRCELPAIAKTDAQLVVMRMELFLKGHLDFNHLIEKGLALEAPEGMYKTE